MESPYHKVPKGIAKRESALLKRVAKVRIGLYNSLEKEYRFRQEIINKRKYTGILGLLKKIQPFILKPQSNKGRGSGEGRSRKVISEAVKGVPKGHTSARRITKEQMKAFMDEDLVDVTKITSHKNDEANKKNQKKQEEDKKSKKKGGNVSEEQVLIQNMEEEATDNKKI